MILYRPVGTKELELIAQSGLSVSAMQTILLELDLAGHLEWASGQLVALRS